MHRPVRRGNRGVKDHAQSFKMLCMKISLNFPLNFFYFLVEKKDFFYKNFSSKINMKKQCKTLTNKQFSMHQHRDSCGYSLIFYFRKRLWEFLNVSTSSKNSCLIYAFITLNIIIPLRWYYPSCGGCARVLEGGYGVF